MKLLVFTIILTLTTCVGQRQNLDFPTKIEEIKKVTLIRPDNESNGKYAIIKDLTKEQTKILLKALGNSKPVGPWKFFPDFYIVFTTTKNVTKRIKINGNKVKGYDNDYSYEIEQLDFLEDF